MREIEQRALDAYRRVFGAEPEVIASAPGRVNLIGDHTDYNGGYVLPCAIDRRVAVAMGEGVDGLYSDDFDELQMGQGCAGGGAWVAYPRGVAWSLIDAGYRSGPFQAAFAGEVPRGAGLSSSAAVEAATALGLARLWSLEIPRPQLALLCQRAENRFVGVQSGIMDQYASVLAREGHALFIDCRLLESELIPLELEQAGLLLLVCDTRVDRQLTGTEYNERRAACDRAARTLGLDSLRDARLEDLDRLTGDDRSRARHVITENARVLAAVDALRQGDFERLGSLMYASHASLRNDYAVSTPELDAVVELSHQSGAPGARLTGAGFGGCALILVTTDRAEALEREIQAAFKRHAWNRPDFYRFHPSEGADGLAPGLKGVQHMEQRGP